MRNDTRAFEGPAGDKAPCKSGRKGWERGAGVVSGRVPGAAEGTRGEKLGPLQVGLAPRSKGQARAELRLSGSRHISHT